MTTLITRPQVGWTGLFVTLAVAMTATAAAIIPAVAVELRALGTDGDER